MADVTCRSGEHLAGRYGHCLCWWNLSPCCRCGAEDSEAPHCEDQPEARFN